MQYLNEIVFLIFAAIAFAMFLSGIALFRKAEYPKNSITCLVAILFHGIAYLCFASASSIHLGLLSFANTFLFLGYLELAIFCTNLRKPLFRFSNSLIFLLGLIFLLIFEYLRNNAEFSVRVSFAIFSYLICLSFALIQILKIRRTNSLQINLLIFGLVVQIFLLCIRLILLYTQDTFPQTNIYSESSLVTAIRWTWFSSSMFWYAPTISIFSELFLEDKNTSTRENNISKLLIKEKETLIYEALKANKTMATSALTASLAHELNQPIAAINLNIASLKICLERNIQDKKTQYEIIESLLNDSQHASKIIGLLRNIFIDKKDFFDIVNCKDLIDKALNYVAPGLKEAGITVHLDTEENLLIKVNSSEVVQVFLNLLNNSIDALSSQPQTQRIISLKVFREGHFIHFSILDNGPGISAELMPNLFNLFETNKKSGMGLGLWLCQYIVTRNQGSIYSENVEDGAKFVILFPVLN
jgi:signal transduction histidine kinase